MHLTTQSSTKMNLTNVPRIVDSVICNYFNILGTFQSNWPAHWHQSRWQRLNRHWPPHPQPQSPPDQHHSRWNHRIRARVRFTFCQTTRQHVWTTRRHSQCAQGNAAAATRKPYHFQHVPNGERRQKTTTWFDLAICRRGEAPHGHRDTSHPGTVDSHAGSVARCICSVRRAHSCCHRGTDSSFSTGNFFDFDY